MQSNGKYAVCCRHAGKLRFRTVGFDLAVARRERAALITAAQRGSVPVSPRLRFDPVSGWWLERLAAKVAAGDRHPRTLEAHRYHLDNHLLPAFASRRIASITVHAVADLLLALRRDRRSAKTVATALARRCTASSATPVATTGSPSTPLISSSPTSARARRVDASACWAAQRSSGCWQPPLRATG